mmetsp:Transcript_58905/g.172412  ORF Transcript_58905/g.172412 Transcript_58905/m.172412 type:complete len:229 (-) Transcript_58905:493-1179(-)
MKCTAATQHPTTLLRELTRATLPSAANTAIMHSDFVTRSWKETHLPPLVMHDLGLNLLLASSSPQDRTRDFFPPLRSPSSLTFFFFSFFSVASFGNFKSFTSLAALVAFNSFTSLASLAAFNSFTSLVSLVVFSSFAPLASLAAFNSFTSLASLVVFNSFASLASLLVFNSFASMASVAPLGAFGSLCSFFSFFSLFSSASLGLRSLSSSFFLAALVALGLHPAGRGE